MEAKNSVIIRNSNCLDDISEHSHEIITCIGKNANLKASKLEDACLVSTGNNPTVDLHATGCNINIDANRVNRIFIVGDNNNIRIHADGCDNDIVIIGEHNTITLLLQSIDAYLLGDNNIFNMSYCLGSCLIKGVNLTTNIRAFDSKVDLRIKDSVIDLRGDNTDFDLVGVNVKGSIDSLDNKSTYTINNTGSTMMTLSTRTNIKVRPCGHVSINHVRDGVVDTYSTERLAKESTPDKAGFYPFEEIFSKQVKDLAVRYTKTEDVGDAKPTQIAI